MKKMFLLSLAFISLVIAARAQQPYRYQNALKDHFLVDTLPRHRFIWKHPLNDTSLHPQSRVSPIDNMPIVGYIRRKPRYVFNNQKGFDVYQAWQDHMFMLKPDSTFAFKMPIAGLEKKLQSLYVDR